MQSIEQTSPKTQKTYLQVTVDRLDNQDEKALNTVTKKSKKVVTKTESRETNVIVEIESVNEEQLDTTKQPENTIPEHV